MTTCSTQKEVTFLRSAGCAFAFLRKQVDPLCSIEFSCWGHDLFLAVSQGVSPISIDQVLQVGFKCFKISSKLQISIPIYPYPNIQILVFPIRQCPKFHNTTGRGYDSRILGHKRDGVPLGSSGHRSSGVRISRIWAFGYDGYMEKSLVIGSSWNKYIYIYVTHTYI